MEDPDDKDKTKNTTWQVIKNGIFNVFIEMLKIRQVNTVTAIILMSTNFLQIYGTLLSNIEYLRWKDDLAENLILNFFDSIRISPMIIRYDAVIFYWLFYSLCIFLRNIGCFEIILIFALFMYLAYCTCRNQEFVFWTLNLLKTNLIYFSWMFYNPLLELFVNIYICKDNTHIIDKSLRCNSSGHIVLMVITTLLIVFAVFIAVIISLLYRQSHANSQDLMADLDNPLLSELTLYKTIVFIIAPLETSYFVLFLLKYIVMIIFTILMLY